MEALVLEEVKEEKVLMKVEGRVFFLGVVKANWEEDSMEELQESLVDQRVV